MVQCIAPLLVVALFHTAQSQNSTDFTSCDAGIYKVGSKASVTCLFHEAINKDKNNGVVVYKRRLTASNDEQEEIVGTCHIKRDTEPKCSAKGGSDFIITKHGMDIVIPQVSLQHEGRYACHVVPGDGITVHECLLNVEGASQPNNVNDVHYNSEKPDSLHGHVKATLALVILIPLAVGVVCFVILAHRKHWFPFKKDAVKPNKDEENAGMLDNGDCGLTGTPSVMYRPSVQESTNLLDNSRAASPPQVEFQPLSNKEDTETRDSQSVASTVMKGDKAEEKNIETKKEKWEREKRERAEKAAEKRKKEAEEERQKQERKAERERRLKDAASKEEKTRIKNEFNAEETRLKQQKKDEEKAHK